MRTLHLKTKEGQPYTSESRKCSHCGLGLAYRNESFWQTQAWTDSPAFWQSPLAQDSQAMHNCRGSTCRSCSSGGTSSMSYQQCNCVTTCGDCRKRGEKCAWIETPATPKGFTTTAQRRNRIYVAGPMTGLPDFNYPAFNAAALELRTQGWHVENPADHGVIEGAQWSDYLAYDLTRLGTCGAIYLLPDWEKSKGARLEVHIAKTLGLEIVLHPHAISPAPFTDTELLDFVEAHTVNVENEWEGPWSALVYEDTSSPITMEDGKTARTAIALAKQRHEQLTGAEA